MNVSETDKNPLNEMREMLLSQRDGLHRKLAEVEDALKGLGLAEKLTRPSRSSGGKRGRRGVVLPNIRMIITEKPGPFSFHTIAENYQSRFSEEAVKDKTISSALVRMAKDGEILLIIEGSGKRAAIYSKPPKIDDPSPFPPHTQRSPDENDPGDILSDEELSKF